MLELILSMYYGQMFIGFVCGAVIALCLRSLIKNNRGDNSMKND